MNCVPAALCRPPCPRSSPGPMRQVGIGPGAVVCSVGSEVTGRDSQIAQAGVWCLSPKCRVIPPEDELGARARVESRAAAVARTCAAAWPTHRSPVSERAFDARKPSQEPMAPPAWQPARAASPGQRPEPPAVVPTRSEACPTELFAGRRPVKPDRGHARHLKPRDSLVAAIPSHWAPSTMTQRRGWWRQ